MKTKEQLKPNFGPAYAAAMYPGLASIFHRHGYALACHGSLARDFDMIAVPWAEAVSDQATVLKDVMTEFALRIVDDGEMKNHGRKAYTLSCGFGECAIDLSFMPATKIRCHHCGSGLLWSEDRGAHCDGCDDFDPEIDLPNSVLGGPSREIDPRK
jgi:hypothetical protein